MSEQNNLQDKRMKKQSLLITVIVIMVLVLLAAGYYIFHQNKQMDVLNEQFNIEKESLEDDFNELSLQYEGYRFSVNNDSIVEQLATEQAKVQRLLEELRTVKSTNAKRISELKRELDTLRKVLKSYVIQIDSLNAANEKLKEENKKVVRQYQQVTNQASKLEKEKKQLTERVTLASRLVATNISVKPLNKRGKFEKRIKKMTQFEFQFTIARNVTAEVGEKPIYLLIFKPDGDVLVKSRINTFVYENAELNYSAKKIVEYEGEDLSVSMYWDIEEYLSPGEYRADIFADGHRIGQKSFILKD